MERKFNVNTELGIYLRNKYAEPSEDVTVDTSIAFIDLNTVGASCKDDWKECMRRYLRNSGEYYIELNSLSGKWRVGYITEFYIKNNTVIIYFRGTWGQNWKSNNSNQLRPYVHKNDYRFTIYYYNPDS